MTPLIGTQATAIGALELGAEVLTSFGAYGKNMQCSESIGNLEDGRVAGVRKGTAFTEYRIHTRSVAKAPRRGVAAVKGRSDGWLFQELAQVTTHNKAQLKGMD